MGERIRTLGLLEGRPFPNLGEINTEVEINQGFLVGALPMTSQALLGEHPRL